MSHMPAYHSLLQFHSTTQLVCQIIKLLNDRRVVAHRKIADRIAI